VDSNPERIVNKFSTVIIGLRRSGFLRSSGNQRTIGSSTPAIKPWSMAMPTSVAMMLLETDLTLASRAARWPGA
jgi:hypothetical protein